MADVNLALMKTSRIFTVRELYSCFLAYPRLTCGSVLLGIILILALGAPLFVNYGPLEQNLTAVLKEPFGSYVFGTDQLGRSILSRSLYGGRLALAVAIVSMSIALIIGVPLGLVSGYKGGGVDSIIMRVMDGFIVFPDLVLALAITYALGPSFWTVTAAIATVNVPKFARVVRSQVLTLRERDFIASAYVVGVSPMRILIRHLLPNTSEVIIVQAALTAGMAIFNAASLSFLGLGVPPPAPGWGGMLRNGYVFLNIRPLMSIVPGILIFTAILSINLIGDGLRDYFDPKVMPSARRR